METWQIVLIVWALVSAALFLWSASDPRNSIPLNTAVLSSALWFLIFPAYWLSLIRRRFGSVA